jgi:fusaric acid resistance family protein
MAVPLVARVTLPHPELWAIAPFGVLPVALADRGPTRAARAERCLTSVVAAACGIAVGGLVLGHALVAALAVVALAAVSGGLSWFGPLASIVALDLLVNACIASGGSLGGPWWRPPVLVLAGGVWTTALLLTGSVSSEVTWAHEPPDARRVAAAAVRLGICVAIAEAAANVRGVERGYWIPLTVAIVLRPELGDVVARTIGRAGGTLVGAAAGAGVLWLLGSGWEAIPVIALLAAALPFLLRRSYMLFAAGISLVVVLLIATVVGHGTAVAVARILDTLVGCGIVLVVGYALWLRVARAMPRRAPSAAGPA